MKTYRTMGMEKIHPVNQARMELSGSMPIQENCGIEVVRELAKLAYASGTHC
ncbi:hypothetical protein [Bacteroides acidifaciens]|uniref:hypothetical protein n=1 Tax=Bacteroides acidifaciens TaxID=85831 RepID=UPI003F690AB2